MHRSYSALYFCPLVQNLVSVVSVLCNTFNAELKIFFKLSIAFCALPLSQKLGMKSHAHPIKN